MYTKVLLLLPFLLILCDQSLAQVNIKSFGANIDLSEGSRLSVPGNIELHEREGKSGNLHVKGDVLLGGNFVNHSEHITKRLSAHEAGRIFFTSQGGRQYIRGTFPMRFPTLVMDNAEGLVLNQGVEISHKLRLHAGKIYTGIQELLILSADSSAITHFGADAYVVGQITRPLTLGRNVFPVGSESHLQLMELYYDSSPNSLYVTASFSETPASLLHSVEADGGSVNELLNHGVWSISGPNASSIPFELRLRAQGYTNGGEEPGMHTLLADKGMGWESIGAEGRPTAIGAESLQVSRQQVSSWGDFAIGKADYILSDTPKHKISEFEVINNGSHERKIGIKFYAQRSGEYVVTLRDLKGRQVHAWTGFALSGYNKDELDLSEFAQGIYLLHLHKDGEHLAKKIW